MGGPTIYAGRKVLERIQRASSFPSSLLPFISPSFERRVSKQAGPNVTERRSLNVWEIEDLLKGKLRPIRGEIRLGWDPPWPNVEERKEEEASN